MSAVEITGLRAVSVPVESQDEALAFYTERLGFSLVRDQSTPNGRYLELAPRDRSVVITLEPARPDVTRGPIGIRFTADDAEATHAAMAAAGVEVDDILRWPGVPAMFGFRDPDGNAFSVTEPA
jgi:lactoylglutathione lyase